MVCLEANKTEHFRLPSQSKQIFSLASVDQDEQINVAVCVRFGVKTQPHQAALERLLTEISGEIILSCIMLPVNEHAEVR